MQDNLKHIGILSNASGVLINTIVMYYGRDSVMIKLCKITLETKGTSTTKCAACADPQSFVRGGPNLIKLFF